MVLLILSNQLFDIVKQFNTHIYIYEHPLYFTKYKYHNIKLILHRVSGKLWYKKLKELGKKVTYLNYDYNIEELFKNNKEIVIFDPVDYDILSEFKKYEKKYDTNVKVYDTPMFVTNMIDLDKYMNENDKLHQTSFYIWQRKRLHILLDNKNKPVGGKWTFDNENRNPFPKDYVEKKINIKYSKEEQKEIDKAKQYIKQFNGIGSDDFYLPVTHESTKKHFYSFVANKLNCFGPYQDGISSDVIFGCHSLLSPLLNIGLITPKYIIDHVIKVINKQNLYSIEGFIRQIIGWREYVRLCYVYKKDELLNSNYLNHTNKLPKVWFNDKINTITELKPVDDVIKKVFKYGYAHHIERLMIVGNFMILNEINPKDVMKWFMLCIDAYPWVMIPNVYGMSQYSSSNLMTTRPYFSSSNYIIKMSNYKKNQYNKINEYYWNEIFDALYYNFINTHKNVLVKNYALSHSVNLWNSKSSYEKKKILEVAKNYLYK